MRGVKPFVGIKNDEVISKIEFGERLALPPESPASLFRLMNLCWQYDPLDRPSFKEAENEIRCVYIYRIAGNFRWVLFSLFLLRRAPYEKLNHENLDRRLL